MAWVQAGVSWYASNARVGRATFSFGGTYGLEPPRSKGVLKRTPVLRIPSWHRVKCACCIKPHSILASLLLYQSDAGIEGLHVEWSFNLPIDSAWFCEKAVDNRANFA